VPNWAGLSLLSHLILVTWCTLDLLYLDHEGFSCNCKYQGPALFASCTRRLAKCSHCVATLRKQAFLGQWGQCQLGPIRKLCFVLIYLPMVYHTISCPLLVGSFWGHGKDSRNKTSVLLASCCSSANGSKVSLFKLEFKFEYIVWCAHHLLKHPHSDWSSFGTVKRSFRQMTRFSRFGGRW